MGFLELVLKLLLAVVAGGLVGLERERRDRPAGLRTHIVVCVGSTLITLVSLLMAGPEDDKTRIAAQIVSGIGFLGAGTIFRAGTAVRGLTTAAGLWTVAGIGMAIAAGGTLLYLALLTAVIVFSVNMWLRTVEDRMNAGYDELVLKTTREHDALARVLEELETRNLPVAQVQWLGGESDEDHATVRLRVRRLPATERARLTARLSEQTGVVRIEWD